MLCELVQNADDCAFAPRVAPTLRISEATGADGCHGWLVHVNECGFSEADVRAISDLGASTKQRHSAATGRKGLGFKSVFAMSDRPYVVSSGYRFRFDVSGPHGLFGALVPLWCSAEEMKDALPPGTLPPGAPLSSHGSAHADGPPGASADGPPGASGTTFWLPRRPSVSLPVLHVAPSTLLFLRRLRTIELVAHQTTPDDAVPGVASPNTFDHVAQTPPMPPTQTPTQTPVDNDASLDGGPPATDPRSAIAAPRPLPPSQQQRRQQQRQQQAMRAGVGRIVLRRLPVGSATGPGAVDGGGGASAASMGEGEASATPPSALEPVAIAIEGSGFAPTVREYLVWRERPLVCGTPTEIVLAFLRGPSAPAEGASGSDRDTDTDGGATGGANGDASSGANGDANDGAAECDIYCWLPVQRVGLPFLVQAEWELVASRQAVHTDSRWNAALRDAAAEALVRAVRAHARHSDEAVSWLPDPALCHEPFWRPLFEARERLRAIPLLRAEDGSCVAPCDAMLRAMTPAAGSGEPIEADAAPIVSGALVSGAWLHASLGGKRFVAAAQVASLGVAVLEHLGCERFSIGKLIRMVQHWEQTSAAKGTPSGCGEDGSMATIGGGAADAPAAVAVRGGGRAHGEMDGGAARTVRASASQRRSRWLCEAHAFLVSRTRGINPHRAPAIPLAPFPTPAHISRARRPP